MKPIVLKRHSKSGGVCRMSIYVFGIHVYESERQANKTAAPRPIGFVQFQDAPGFVDDVDDDDCFPEEF